MRQTVFAFVAEYIGYGSQTISDPFSSMRKFTVKAAPHETIRRSDGKIYIFFSRIETVDRCGILNCGGSEKLVPVCTCRGQGVDVPKNIEERT